MSFKLQALTVQELMIKVLVIALDTERKSFEARGHMLLVAQRS